MDKSKKGGARKGAGAPKKIDKKIMFARKLHPDAIAIIKRKAKELELSDAKTLENIIYTYDNKDYKLEAKK